MNAGPALRDILLPPPGWWPPAPGWWLLALGLALGLIWLGRVLWRRWRRRRRRQWVLAEFEAAAQDGAEEPAARLARLSILLRRAAGRCTRSAAALTGADWLRFLDGGDPAQPFSHGAGRVLADGPYRAQLEPDALAAALPLIRRRLLALLEAAGHA